VRDVRPLWIGAAALVGFALVIWLRPPALPQDVSFKAHADPVAAAPPTTPEIPLRVPVEISRPRPRPIDPKDLDLRYDARGRKHFEFLRPEQQADEMTETIRDEAKALDLSLNDLQRCHAFESLARRGAISPTIASSLAQLLQSSPHAAVRENLSTAVKGRLDQEVIVEALLGRVLSDPQEMVRKRAAQSLGERLDDPRIRGALERASASDSSPFVQDVLRRMLQKDVKPTGTKKS
jgi:hypothetical protein